MKFEFVIIVGVLFAGFKTWSLEGTCEERVTLSPITANLCWSQDLPLALAKFQVGQNFVDKKVYHSSSKRQAGRISY
jgi:hypothetical protein